MEGLRLSIHVRNRGIQAVLDTLRFAKTWEAGRQPARENPVAFNTVLLFNRLERLEVVLLTALRL